MYDNELIYYKWITLLTIVIMLFFFQCGVQKHEFGLHSDSSKLEFFEAFVFEFLLGKVVFETNRYAEQYKQFNKISHQSRVNAQKDTNIGEIYTFLATTILMSRNKKLDMKDYWSTDPLLSPPIFRQIISRNRYFHSGYVRFYMKI